MKEKNMQMESMIYTITIDDHLWRVKLPKSQTKMKDMRQLELLMDGAGPFLEGAAHEVEDQLVFTYMIDRKSKEWQAAKDLPRHEKLRLLSNLARIRDYLSSRITFFLHPDNLVFDENLLPFVLYRGLRNMVPPFVMEEEKLLLQYKCLIVALFTEKYTFEELYGGTLNDAGETEFERNVIAANDWTALTSLLNDNYMEEKKKADREMTFISKKRFTLFKRSAYILGTAVLIMAVPLIYLLFMKLPEQDQLLNAHSYFLTENYDGAIEELESMTPEDLPKSAKYMLAYSYIKTEGLSENEKANILKNVSMKTEDHYLLYWIYHGLGDFDKSLDLALYMDDPVLTVHALFQQIEKAKNDPDLTGTEREEKVKEYEDKLKSYQEEYGLKPASEQETESEETSGSIQEEPAANEVQKAEEKPAANEVQKAEEKPAANEIQKVEEKTPVNEIKKPIDKKTNTEKKQETKKDQK